MFEERRRFGVKRRGRQKVGVSIVGGDIISILLSFLRLSPVCYICKLSRKMNISKSIAIYISYLCTCCLFVTDPLFSTLLQVGFARNSYTNDYYRRKRRRSNLDPIDEATYEGTHFIFFLFFSPVYCLVVAFVNLICEVAKQGIGHLSFGSLACPQAWWHLSLWRLFKPPWRGQRRNYTNAGPTKGAWLHVF